MTVTTAIYSSRGQAFQVAPETALGTTTEGAYLNVRPESDWKGPSTCYQGAANPNTYHAQWANTEDKPVTYPSYLKDSLSFGYKIRTIDDDSDDTWPVATGRIDPLIILAMASAGCATGVTGSNTETLANYADLNTFTLTGNTSGVGQGTLVRLGASNDGVYWPVVPASYVPNVIEPWVDLPSASNTGNTVGRMHYAYPQCAAVGATSSLSFRHLTRGWNQTISAVNTHALVYTGCTLSKIAPFKITGTGVPQMALTFHVGNVNQATGHLIEEVGFADSDEFAAPFSCGGTTTKARFNLVASVASATPGKFASTYTAFEEAEIDLGINTVVIEGTGANTGVNGYQAAIQAYTQPTAKVTWRMKQEMWDYWEGGASTNTSYALEWAMPTANPLTSPAWILSMPNCHMISAPEAELVGKDWLSCTCTFGASASNVYDPDTITASVQAPWFFAISGKA